MIPHENRTSEAMYNKMNISQLSAMIPQVGENDLGNVILTGHFTSDCLSSVCKFLPVENRLSLLLVGYHRVCQSPQKISIVCALGYFLL